MGNGYDASASSTSLTISTANMQPNIPWEYRDIPIGFWMYANYTGSNSASAYALLNAPVALQAATVTGPHGNVAFIIPNPPSDLSYMQVYRQQGYYPVDFDVADSWYAEMDITASLDFPLGNGYFSISASNIINNVCEIPNSSLPPYFDYNIWVQTVRSNGVSSGWEQIIGPAIDNGVANTPFADERQQLKDNLRFLLRAADDYPFAFVVDQGGEGCYLPPYFACPLNNYLFAGFYGEGGVPYYGVFGELQPIYDNCFYRNCVFDQNNLTPEGLVNTGCSGGNSYLADGCVFEPCLTIPNFPAYYFNPAGYLTNNQPIPSSQLASSETQWILPADGGVFPLNGGMISTQNFYGLPILSAKCAYVNTNNQLVVATYYPGQTLPSGVNGVEYIQTAQPVLTNAGYYFARPNYDPVPEQNEFSAPGTTPAIFVGVGTSQQIAGYAQLGIQNGYADTYAYLGQYFQQAYQIDANGNVTANTTGILSPYGDFYATQPGPVALVTMPDVDTGEQGTCTVYCVSLQLDANHDGTMDTNFNGSDSTSTNNPCVFWANNNFDRWATNSGYLGAYTDNEQDDQQIAFSPLTPTTPTPDCNYSNVFNDGFAYRAIPCTRDLEDFARLWVCGMTPNLLAALPTGSTVTLSWGDVNKPNSNNPTIDLFTAADPNGGIGYQTNEMVATAQINAVQCPYIGRLAPGGSIQLNASQFANQWAGNYFTWCGVSNGTGGLVLTIADGSGNTLAQTTAYIQIVDIKQMYERYTVGDNSAIAPLATPILASENLPVGVPSFRYPPPQNTNTSYILHVHGYNMPTWAKDRFAEAEYKRLYWQGYQGRFGSFRWPTTVQNFSLLTILSDAQAFDLSEANAWASWNGLLNLLTNLDKTYGSKNVYLTAHSHGNVVAGEALRQATEQGLGQVVNTYVAMQAAVDSHTYDATASIRPLLPSYSTPDRYGQYYTNGAPCYFDGVAGAATYVNFFNTNDWALVRQWK